ncbi:MAG: hypothetical protein IIC61_06080, partial [Proteobacteria bacterium]|nr:hypothetical protein [Pseudomonadota bacterium]
MTMQSAKKSEKYSRTAARAITTFVLVSMLLTGCATRPKVKLSDAFNEQAIAAEITASGPIALDSEYQAVNQKMIRKSAMAAQASILFVRSVHIDPINRPVSNFLSMTSYALKSATGLFRRTALNTVQFPALEREPIPESAYADSMDLEKWEKDLDRISGRKPSRGTIEFLIDGKEYLPRMLEAVGDAKESIDIRTYIFDNDDYAVKVADVLKEKSQDVRVRVLVDAFGTMVAVIAVWRFWSREDSSDSLASPLIPATTLVALAIVDNVAFWGFSGLETPLYMLLLTGSALVFMRERRAGGPPWSAVAFAFVAMTRPEGLVAAAVTGLFLLGGIQHAAERRTILLHAAAWAGTFWALYGAYFLWRFAYYGHFYPNTYYAKTEMALVIYERGADYLSGAVVNYHLVLAFVGVTLLFFTSRLRREAAYVGALSAALLLAIIPEGGDAFGHGRLITPVLPLLYLAGIAGFATALARLRIEPRQRVLIAAATLSVLALLLLRGSDNPFLPEDRADQTERKILGLWLNEHTPDDYTIAAWAVGSIAYHSERDVLDLFGLTDDVIAHTDVDNFGEGLPGHERHNAD